ALRIGVVPKLRTSRGMTSVSLGPAIGFRHLRQLLGLAEHADGNLGLRIDGDQMALGFRRAEHRFVDAESDHRPNEIALLLERFFIDADSLVLEMLAKIRQHCVIDSEVHLDQLATGRLLRYARVAVSCELLRVVVESLACLQGASESTWVESKNRPDHSV